MCGNNELFVVSFLRTQKYLKGSNLICKLAFLKMLKQSVVHNKQAMLKFDYWQ